jgi:hypothetical protein
MSRGPSQIFATLVATLVFVVALGADTLVLKNGRRVEGRLVGVRDGTIEFEERGFRPRVLRLNQYEVQRIEFEDRQQDQDRFPPDGGGRPGVREREVDVSSRQSWTDTGIDVRPGQSVSFRATGEVRWGPSRRDGAEGENNSPRNPARPLPSRPAAALIGRIGDDVFFIGGDRSPIRLRGGGRLYLGINDDYLQDNTGSLRVTVYY